MSRPVTAGLGKVAGGVILAIAAIAFALPLLALLLFTFRMPGRSGGLTLDHYLAIVDPTRELTYDGLFMGLVNSLGIAVVTVAIVLLLLVPTLVLVELRYPRVRRAIEVVCLLPLTVPTVVLVVGFVPVYKVVSGALGSAPWTLAFAVGVIVLPYAYRPIQANIAALDIVVLSEAARSLGANGVQVVWRVVLPNLRRGILSACLLTVAVVLGEYTIAAFLSRTTFQTALFLLQQTDPYVSAIFSLAALAMVFVLLLLIGRLGSFRPSRSAS